MTVKTENQPLGWVCVQLGHFNQISQNWLQFMFFFSDAALIPLIEDLFKELAMIEACNKVVLFLLRTKQDIFITYSKAREK